LFTCSKAAFPCLWNADSGERIGTYRGHTGAVWSIDVNGMFLLLLLFFLLVLALVIFLHLPVRFVVVLISKLQTASSTHMISGSADTMAKLWDVSTGKELYNWNHRTPVRSVNYALGGKQFFTVTDQVMGRPATILIYNLDEASKQSVFSITFHNLNSPGLRTTLILSFLLPILSHSGRETPHREIVSQKPNAKITMALWGPLNKTIVACSDDGLVTVFEPDTGKVLHVIRDHTKAVGKIDFSHDQSHFITASQDHTCKIYDSATFKLIKSYDTGRPVNDASLSPLLPHVSPQPFDPFVILHPFSRISSPLALSFSLPYIPIQISDSSGRRSIC
jgi:WD40 repeat protein